MIKFSTVSDFLNRGTASVSSWSTLGVIVYEVGTFLSSGFLFIRIETAPSQKMYAYSFSPPDLFYE